MSIFFFSIRIFINNGFLLLIKFRLLPFNFLFHGFLFCLNLLFPRCKTISVSLQLFSSHHFEFFNATMLLAFSRAVHKPHHANIGETFTVPGQYTIIGVEPDLAPTKTERIDDDDQPIT